MHFTCGSLDANLTGYGINRVTGRNPQQLRPGRSVPWIWGKGQPIVFSHGWPLSADDWDAQMMFFLNRGYRVIAHDRRGHGRSAQVSDGHDMDHYADDGTARAVWQKRY